MKHGATRGVTVPRVFYTMANQDAIFDDVYNIFPVNLIYTQGKDKPEKKPAVRGWQTHTATLADVSECQNLGVGVPEGHVFIDLDTYKGVTRAAVEAVLGCALDWVNAMLQRTVSGGEHYCFKVPDGAALRQGSDVLGVKGFDTRCHAKGWICTGAGYEDLTLVGMPLAVFIEAWPALPAPAVEKLLDTGAGLAVDGGDGKEPLGYTHDQLREILGVLDPAPEARDEWLAVGMALHHETQGSREGFRLFNEWSGSKDDRGEYLYANYSPDSVRTAWQSFGRKGKGVALTTARTLRMMAAERGLFVDPNPVEVEDFDEFPEAVVEAAPTFKRDKKGKIEATISNVEKALDCDSFCGVKIRFDEFKDEIMVAPSGTCDWRTFTDADYPRIRIALENKGFKPVSRDLAREAVLLLADENRFDSAIEWLESLDWDGVPRIDTFLTRYFSVQSTDYSVAVSRYMWSALAGRVLSPGCKVDMMPIFYGAQGVGKSSGVAAMVPDPRFFSEFSFGEREDDLSRKMRGCLIGEFGELRGLHTRELEHIKAFVTRPHEKWVPKFKEFTSSFPRRLLFIGTTNQKEFLADETGNRRWLPVEVGQVDTAAITADRLQLWAEGRQLFKAVGVCYKDAQGLATATHAEHTISDDWEFVIGRWLGETDLLTGQPNCEKVLTSVEILSGALSIDAKHVGRREQMRLSKVMMALGYERGVRRIGGVIVRCYVGEVPF